MALTSKIEIKVDLPHEPGEWITLRMPSVSMMAGLDLEQAIESTITVLQQCVKAWSYAEPVTPDNVADLDLETVRVLEAVLFRRDEDERKND